MGKSKLLYIQLPGARQFYMLSVADENEREKRYKPERDSSWNDFCKGTGKPGCGDKCWVRIVKGVFRAKRTNT